jgi:hypothetical protein
VPTIHPALRASLTLIAPLLLAVAPIIPAPVGPIVAIVAFIAGGLAGLVSPLPKWVQKGTGYVPAALVPTMLTLSAALFQLADSASGVVRLALQGAALLLTFLAGKYVPPPPPPAPVKDPMTEEEAAAWPDKVVAGQIAGVVAAVEAEDKALAEAAAAAESAAAAEQAPSEG